MTPLKIRKIRLQRPPFQTAHDSSILPRHAPPKLLPKYSGQRPLRSGDFNLGDNSTFILRTFGNFIPLETVYNLQPTMTQKRTKPCHHIQPII